MLCSSPTAPDCASSATFRYTASPRRVWFTARGIPASAHAATTRSAPARLLAMGFSRNIALTPASTTARAISSCMGVGVATLTMSGCSDSSISR